MPIIGRAIRGTSITRPGSIFFPQLRDVAKIKIELVDSDNDATDVVSSCDLINASFTWRSLRKGTGQFNILVSNKSRKYLDRYVEGDTIKFYGDFDDASTQIFEARMEQPRFGYQNGWIMAINGMKNPELSGTKITKVFTQASAIDAFQEVLNDTFGVGTFTFNNMDATMTTPITSNYDNLSVLKILRDILAKAGFDGYIDIDNDVHTFPESGSPNANEQIFQGPELISLSQFGIDTLQRLNRVSVYGATLESIPIIRTETTTQTPWRKERIFKVQRLESLTDVEEEAETILSNAQVGPTLGTTTTKALATIRPGDKIPVRILDAGIDGNFKIPEYTQIFGPGWSTMSNLESVDDTVADFHKQHDDDIVDLRELSNPNDMRNTLILLTFDNEDDIENLSNCELSNGSLILSTGFDTGTMNSDTQTNDNNFASAEVRGEANTDFLQGPSTIEVSNDNGSNYETITDFGTPVTLSTTGKLGKLRVTIKSDATYPNPELRSIGMLVNT